MGGASIPALLAISTRDVDIAYHALTNPALAICCNHFTDEFMSEDARKRIVSFDQFQIGIANSGFADANKRLARLGGFGYLA
jgi:hypothetical protein